MYTLLVVDDEEYALMGITQGIDWHPLDISRVLSASSGQEARQLLMNETVHVVISDIEMPGESGIDLLVWMQQHCPDIPVLFLTGHANFQYARQALQHGCVEYLLKPVDYDQLAETVGKVLAQSQLDQSQALLASHYMEYKQLWEHQKPAFMGHLWRDILEGRMPADSHRIRDLFETMEIPVAATDPVTLVLIKVEQWLEEMDLKDREVMRFAVRNVAEETLLVGLGGLVFQMEEDSLMAVVYDTDASDGNAILFENTEAFIETCNLHLACHLSCYISTPAKLPDLSEAYKELLRQEQENLTRPNSVLRLEDFRNLATSTLKAPDFAEWTILLESGKLDVLQGRIREFLNRIHEGHASKEMLESFCFGIISMAYTALHKSGLQASGVFPDRERLHEGSRISSPEQARLWAVSVLTTVHQASNDSTCHESSMVREVKRYIENHILQDFSREDIAGALHFNADYLSRVFKKETGTVLSDYIISRRMSMARKLLEETNDRIADIAHTLGYNHFSHFARQFRNMAGMTPQEYRMKNRKIIT